MAPNLLDLVFNDSGNAAANLPQAEYLPALQRQQELEKQLAQQQVTSLAALYTPASYSVLMARVDMVGNSAETARAAAAAAAVSARLLPRCSLPAANGRGGRSWLCPAQLAGIAR